MLNDSSRTRIGEQIAYYAERKPVRIMIANTPYVRRHFAEALARVPISADDAVCEWGAGMGRFTELLTELGCPVMAVELSPALAEGLQRIAATAPQVTVAVGDIREVAQNLHGQFDVVAGFFMLHHLPEVPAYLAAAMRMLKPGGRFVFVEPNPLNPLYAVQVTLTPGMRWREEIGIYRMGRVALEQAAREAGFVDVTTNRYGALPRALYNFAARWRIECWPEPLTPMALRPFQVFAGRKG